MAKRHHDARLFEVDWRTLLHEDGTLDRRSFMSGWQIGSLVMALRNDLDIADQCLKACSDLELRQMDLIAMCFGCVLVTTRNDDDTIHVHVRKAPSA